MRQMRTVFIANRSYHDYTPATSFGKLVFLSQGQVNKMEIGAIYREFEQGLKDSHEHDLFMPTALPILCGIGTAIMVAKHGKVNYLIFQHGRYFEKTIDLSIFSGSIWRNE